MNAQIRRVGLVLMLLFVALFAKLNELQVVRADELANHPGNNRKIVKDFSAPRGDIITADGTVVATSVASGDGYKRLRQYPTGALFGHITGYFSFTFGTAGVERTYNDELSGRAASVKIRKPRDLLVDADNTGDVVLTLSRKVQEAAAAALANRKGSIVALDPTTGAVLAMVSSPSYDPNPLAGHDQKAVQAAFKAVTKPPTGTNPDNPARSRAFSERIFPGSTFKVITSAAVLERAPELAAKSYPQLKEILLPQTTRPLRNFGGSTCGGVLPDLLVKSCNTGFAAIGLDLGGGRLVGEAEDFGFNARPPLDIGPTVASSIPSAADLDKNKPVLAKSAIGQQDVAATPLHMAMIAGAVGYGGVMMTPHVMSEVRDRDGSKVSGYEPKEWKRAMEAGTAGQLRDLMVQVVARGTATRAAVPGITVAAKTGTAQTGANKAHAWLVAFAPAEAPKVAVAIVIEDQPEVNEATGGRLAAPIAATIIRAALGL
ncbi:MAG TPA: penicillin-binding protein 2 [Acidimicrobiales bacterium]|nr:penicillin-binding protein 2 [Acidimicrobiales bacterium]